jgi:SAM-dependent methyltransferase
VNPATLDDFIVRWQNSAAAERANYSLFLTQLCDLLGVPQPDPTQAETERNAYVFERDVKFDQGDGTSTTGRIDLYKRGCFVLEAKQGSDAQRAEEEAARALLPAGTKSTKKKGTAVRGTKAWDDAMVRARGQAEAYAKALPTSEGWPPFLIVVDVGHSIELYSEFTRAGKAYVMFPDPQSFRIKLEDLRDEKIRTRLAAVWTDPLSLDPSRRAAKVTRELAERLAALAKLLEKAGHDPAAVAKFLMRCLFTMFAEDVGLLDPDSFKNVLRDCEKTPETFKPIVQEMWQAMNFGLVSTTLRKKVMHFNGGLFAEFDALPLDTPMVSLLLDAASKNWADVEPAIFGTLLERALDERERHKLGAHFTPRAYVERLVMPTVIEPLRNEWKTAYAAAISHAQAGEMDEAQAEVRGFHDRLCKTRVLDPACGSGNFLYVTLEHMKRIEGEVVNALHDFGDKQKLFESHEVNPSQFLGIELNERAAAIADLVLWIGYLQWHFRTYGKALPPEPIIKKYDNIVCRDAVLAWDRTEPLLDAEGQPVTRWDGRTTKQHPVTGEEVPDENARTAAVRYVNPRKAIWEKADYIVGNPPFIGKRGVRGELATEYVDAIHEAYPELPRNIDFVMYWWHRAAQCTSTSVSSRFGLITTSKIVEEFNAQVVNSHMIGDPPVLLAYALPDHPWVDSADGADVRIAMTVGDRSAHVGILERLTHTRGGTSTSDSDQYERRVGLIQPDLTIGPNILGCSKLKANLGVSAVGFQFNGKGFVLTPEQAHAIIAKEGQFAREVVRPFVSTKDITGISRRALMIDLYGRTIEEVRATYPNIYQWILQFVKPEREVTSRQSRRERWWIFGEALGPFRPAMAHLKRMIATPITSKHRIFVFLDRGVGVDSTTVMIAFDSSNALGILSSRVHSVWALRAGSKLGVGNDPRYNKTRCFEKFPFPDCPIESSEDIGRIAEQLDAHRKRQQALHPRLTLTDMYNVLEKLRSGEALSAKEKTIHDQGLVSVLRQIHDDLDAAVFAAYGWPADLTDEQILERLVALNAERAEEEKRGLIRWLRPEFQAPQAAAGGKQAELDLVDDEPAETKPKKGAKKAAAKGAAAKPAKAAKLAWPKERGQRTKAVQEALAGATAPLTPDEIAKQFSRGNAEQVAEILAALCSLGLARKARGRFSRVG